MEIKLPKSEYAKYLITKRCREDWNVYIRDICGVHLDREQQKIISSIQFHPLTSVRSGTARGKDFAAAWGCFCFFALTPMFRTNEYGEIIITHNTKVAMTAPTDRQIKNIMHPEISRIYEIVRKRNPEMVYPMSMRQVSYDIRTRFDDWFLTGFKADNKNTEAWSGFHAANVMFAVTEASGMDETIFDSIEGNLQGNSRLLIVFNPNRSIGYAARSTKKEGWNKFKLNSLDSPNVTEKKIIIPGQVDYMWVLDKIKNRCTQIEEKDVKRELNDFQFEGKWYRPDDWFRIKVLGEFPETPVDVLIPISWVEAANERWKQFVKEQRIVKGPARVGTDVAGMGDDDTVIITRHREFVSEIKNYNSGGVANHMETAGETKVRLKTIYDAAIIDTVGEGAGVFSRLNELNQNVYSAKSNMSAKGLVDITKEYTFGSLRDYLYWAIRDWLNPAYDSDACLPPNERLTEELTEIKWGYDSQGRPTIEKKDKIKERIKRSPDYSDSLALTFFPEKWISTTAIKASRLSGMY